MQLGGIGDNHGVGMHHVTSCLHDHEHSLEGNLKMPTNPSSASQQAMQANQDQNAQLSLSDWIQKLFRSTGNRFLGFWRGNDTPSTGQTGEKTGASQTMAQINNTSDTSVTNNANQTKQAQLLQQNPYFAAVDAEAPRPVQPSLGQRIKMKCKEVASQLADHLPGRFVGNFSFGKNGSFHARKEGTKENLSRRSKYREDTLEIDCVLTDESYLLDSYDRKGEYTQLTTKK